VVTKFVTGELTLTTSHIYTDTLIYKKYSVLDSLLMC